MKQTNVLHALYHCFTMGYCMNNLYVLVFQYMHNFIEIVSVALKHQTEWISGCLPAFPLDVDHC